MGFWNDIGESFKLKSFMKKTLKEDIPLKDQYNKVIEKLYDLDFSEGTRSNILEDINKTFIKKGLEL